RRAGLLGIRTASITEEPEALPRRSDAQRLARSSRRVSSPGPGRERRRTARGRRRGLRPWDPPTSPFPKPLPRPRLPPLNTPTGTYVPAGQRPKVVTLVPDSRARTALICSCQIDTTRSDPRI